VARAIRPDGFGIIIRTAAEGASEEALQGDAARLVTQWEEIAEAGSHGPAPRLIYQEPELVMRVIREIFGPDFRRVSIDDDLTYRKVLFWLDTYAPDLKEKVVLYDDEKLGLFERYHVSEQIRKALDRKVWLPSGGHIIIDRTEALTVIDVNTGKNVGKDSLEDTVYQNNLEAAEEISRQLRLRDIGGIVVIDFIDMEVRRNRKQVVGVFKDCLAAGVLLGSLSPVRGPRHRHR
jgi:ribonuclease E